MVKDTSTSSSFSWDYALFSANIHYFMPALDWVLHEGIYRDWQVYHAAKPFAAGGQWDTVAVESVVAGQPAIICLYHLGYHGQIPLALAAAGLQFDILLDRKVYALQQVELLRLQAKMQCNGNSYRFLFSDDPQVLLQARSAIRQGRHLLIFADGNSGAGDKASRVSVRFLAGELAVRQGIALLSYLLKVPIVPVSHRPAVDGMTLFTGKRIDAAGYTDRRLYISTAMQALYDFLAAQIINQPHVWESWNYLQEMDCFEIKEAERLFNGLVEPREHWLGLQIGGKSGYFDRKHYQFIEI